jgi:hypothetical protein
VSAEGTKCGIHGLELEEVRPGKWLCPEPECTHIITDATIAKVRDVFWAQDHGIVHPDTIVIGGGEEAQP